ncbi:MAG: hypothetical protein Kow0010_08790 [Dehalococcoidia bacterium]
MTARGAAATTTAPAVTVGALAWAAVAAAFVLLRLGPVFQAPVGGPELVHLSGAWQASAGFEDARFVPTLLQAIAALTFEWTESEVPARLVAFAATATVPVALYLLRPVLGNAGALCALAVLAFDAPAIALGSTASAMGLDVAIAAWLAVVVLRGGLPAPAWAAVAFILAASGPLALPLVVSAAGVAFARRDPVRARTLAWMAAGAALAVALATWRYGLGVDGLRVPPLDLLAAGYEERWSSATTARLAAVYGGPVLVAGLAAAAVSVVEAWRSRRASREQMILLAWAGLALGWLATSLTAHSPLPLAAATMPLALLLGPAIVRAASAVARAEWRVAIAGLPLAFLAFTIVYFVLARWARSGSRGGDFESTLLVLMLVMGVVALAIVAAERRSTPTLFIAAGVPFALLLVATASGVAFSGSREPIPSPVSTENARMLRDIAMAARSGQGGLIVVHARYRDEATWPLRGARGVVAASRIPPDATVLIWPAGTSIPDGYSVVEGDWSLLLEFHPPGDILDYVRWLGDRTRVDARPERIAVYMRNAP